MKKFRIRIAVFCAVLFSLSCITFLGIFISHNLTKGSRQSDYPKLPAPANAETTDANLSQQVNASNLIVDATVIKVLPDEVREYIPEKDSAEAKVYEKEGITKSEYTVRPVELKINKTIKGNSSSDTITMYLTPVEIGYSPDFGTYKHLLFILSKYIDGGYTSTTLQDSYYYISADNKIYPAVPSDELKLYSGIPIDNFEADINNLH